MWKGVRNMRRYCTRIVVILGSVMFMMNVFSLNAMAAELSEQSHSEQVISEPREEPMEELSEEPSEELSGEPSEEASEEPSEESEDIPEDGTATLDSEGTSTFCDEEGETVVSNAIKELPKAGGSGNVWFVEIGLAMIAFAGTLWIIQKRRYENQGGLYD